MISDKTIQFLGLQKYSQAIMNHDALRINESVEQELLQLSQILILGCWQYVILVWRFVTKFELHGTFSATQFDIGVY